MLQVLAAGVLWGTVGPAQVMAGSSAPPVTLGAARILLGGMILAAFVLLTRRGEFRGMSLKPLLAASAATGIFQASFLTAVDRTGAAVATAVVFGLVPVTTGVVERIVLGTRLTGRWGIGTGFAIVGCSFLTIPGASVSVDLAGVGLGIVAACCFGTYTVAAKRLSTDGASMPAAVSVTLLVGGTFLLPWATAGIPDLVKPQSIALVAWLGVAATAVAYMFFVTGLRRITPSTAGTLGLAEPLVAAALALLVLGERLSPSETAGAALLLGGLALVSLPTRLGKRGRAQGVSTTPVNQLAARRRLLWVPTLARHRSPR